MLRQLANQDHLEVIHPEPSTNMPALHQSFETFTTSKASTKVDVSVIDSEKQENSWDGYLEDDIPEKTQPKKLRNLRHLVFSLYRRLFTLVFVTNMAVFIAFLVRGRANTKDIAQVVVANLFCAILMRQDYVINAFFNVFCSVPTS